MAEKRPVSYKDPYWSELSAKVESELQLPTNLLRSIVTHGERSNADQVSDAGAKTVFQITPSTRSLVLKKYGIDAYLSDENAAKAAGLLLQEGLKRNNNDPIMAAREYHGGVNRDNWGNINKAYAQRIAEGLQSYKKSTVNPAANQKYDYVYSDGEIKTAQGEPIGNFEVPEDIVRAYENRTLPKDKASILEQGVKEGFFTLPARVYPPVGDQQPEVKPRTGLTKSPTDLERASSETIGELQDLGSGVLGVAKDIASLPVGGVTAIGKGLYDLARNEPNFNARQSLSEGFSQGVGAVQNALPGDSSNLPMAAQDILNAFPGVGSVENQLAKVGAASRALAAERNAVNQTLKTAAIADKPLVDKGVDFVVGASGDARQPYAPPNAPRPMPATLPEATTPRIAPELPQGVAPDLPPDITAAQKIANKTGISSGVNLVYDPASNSIIDTNTIAEQTARGKFDVAPWADKVDPEALQAAERLNVDAPISAILGDKQAQTVAATAESVRGDVYGARQQYQSDLSRAAAQELEGLGGKTDASAIDTIVKSKLEEEYAQQKNIAKNIFEGTEDTPSVIASPEFRGGEVDLSPLIAAINQRKSTGKNISPYFGELEKKITDGTLRTFEDVKTEATKLNASRFDPLHPNIDSYESGLINRALSTIKQNYANAFGAGDEMKVANEATRQYKTISDQLDSLFGYDRNKSLWNGLDTGFKDLANGKPQKFNEVINAVPSDVRKNVVFSSVLKKFSQSPEDFNFAQYNKWWSGVNKNSESFKALKQEIGKDGAELLHDIYKASRRMVETSREFIGTGAISTVQKTFNDANTRVNAFGSKLMQFALRTGLTEVGSTLAGLPGAGVAASAASAQLNFRNKDLLRSLDSLLASPEFKKILVSVAKGKNVKAAESLAKMPQVNNIAKQTNQAPSAIVKELVTTDKAVVARSITQNNKRYVKIDNKTQEPVTYKIIEADDLLPSKNVTDNQPRDRNRIASLAQVQSIANNLNYDELGVFPLMNHGAPVLANDGKTIIAGNGRAMGIKRAYDIDKASEYKSRLAADLKNLGIDDDISLYKKPVLVRQFDNDVDIKKYSLQSNEGGGAMRMSKKEESAIDASRLPKQDLLYDSSGNIDSIENMPQIREWINQYPIEERAALTTANGRLSAEGIARLKNALVHTAYGDTSVLRTLTENADEGGRNMFMALKNNADIVSSVKNGIKEGRYYSNDISADIVSAVDKINTLKENGMTVKDYMQQAQMFDDGMSNVARELMQLFADNQRSPKKLYNTIREYYTTLMNRGSPSQGASMFDEEPVTSIELLNIAKKKVEDKQ